MKSKQAIESQWIVLVLLAAASWAAAGDVTYNAIDTGWYRNDGFHDQSNANYITGRLGDFRGIPGDYRGFHVFSFSSQVPGIVYACTLELFNGSTLGYFGDATEQLNIYDVTTSIATLVTGGSGLTEIYDDLGSGAFYGTETVSEADEGFYVTIDLNAAFVSAANKANSAGGDIAVGTALSSIAGPNNQYIFGNSGEAPTDSRLRIFFDPDSDYDGIADPVDNCPTVFNPDQADCQPNGIGDACDPAPDCDGNMIPDICDVATGVSSDCNVNGIPDECESPVCPYTLGPVTVNSGGLPSMSDGNDYELVASTGQEGGVGLVVSDGNSYTSADGFWHSVYYCHVELYGDIAPVGNPDGLVELTDVLCVLAGYNTAALCTTADIAPCTPDGIIELGDILAVLAAYSGVGQCPGPCS